MLQRVLPSPDNFRIAHRALKLFLKLHGLVGARFGFLGGFHLAVLLARVCLLLPTFATPAQIVRVFFHTYARWDWGAQCGHSANSGCWCENNYQPIYDPRTHVRSDVEKPTVVITTANASAHSLG